MMRGIWRVGSPDITRTQRLHLLILFLFHHLCTHTHSQWQHDTAVLPTNIVQLSEVAVSSLQPLVISCLLRVYMTKIAADEGTLRDVVECHQAPPTVGGARVMVSVNNVIMRLLTCPEYGRQPFCAVVHVAPLCCHSNGNRSNACYTHTHYRW